VQMQQQQQNGGQGQSVSPAIDYKTLPILQGQHITPVLDKSMLQQQNQHASDQSHQGGNQQNQPHQTNQQTAAQQAQLLRMQVAAVNDEILKTLSNAGPQTFMKALVDTMKHRGTPLTTFPRVDEKEVDLFKLYKVVQQRGGSALVSAKYMRDSSKSGLTHLSSSDPSPGLMAAGGSRIGYTSVS
jgi:hypothetical protein